MGGNSGVPIYLVIYLGRDTMPLSIVTKCHNDLTKTVWLTERSVCALGNWAGYRTLARYDTFNHCDQRLRYNWNKLKVYQ